MRHLSVPAPVRMPFSPIEYYLRVQEIAADNVPVIYTTLPERLSAIRNVFGNMTPTLYGFWDIRYLYRSDR